MGETQPKTLFKIYVVNPQRWAKQNRCLFRILNHPSNLLSNRDLSINTQTHYFQNKYLSEIRK